MELQYDSAITPNGDNSYTINLGGRLDVLLDASEQDFTLEFTINSQIKTNWNTLVEVIGPSNINIQNSGYSNYYKLVMGSTYDMGAYSTTLTTDVYYRISRVDGIITIYIKLLGTNNTYYHSKSCTDYISSIYIGNYNHENKITGYIKDIKFISESSKNYSFKANFQNTLDPQIGTFTNVGDKSGVFTLENGEYYLTNNTSTSYREYLPTKNILDGTYIIECDVYFNPSTTSFRWILLFNGNGSDNWWGLGSKSDVILSAYNKSDTTVSTLRNTWVHIKIETTCKGSQCTRNIYVDNVLVTSVVHEIKYDISYMDILGNSGGYVSNARLKNLVIYTEGVSHNYLDENGLSVLWNEIKNRFVPLPKSTFTPIATDTWNISGTANSYTPSDNGYLYLNVSNASAVEITDVNGTIYSATHNGNFGIRILVVKDMQVDFKLTCDTINYLRFVSFN